MNKTIKTFSTFLALVLTMSFSQISVSANIQTKYKVSAQVVVMEKSDGSCDNKYPLENVNVVINGNIVATTDSDGYFSTQLSSGTYKATLDYAYGYDRDISITVYNRNVQYNNPIAIVSCNYIKDGAINVKDTQQFDKGYDDYNIIYDLNKDGIVNDADYNIFNQFLRVGKLSSITYYEVNIVGEKVDTTAQPNNNESTKKVETVVPSTTKPAGYTGPTKTKYENFRVVPGIGSAKIAWTTDAKLDGYYIYMSENFSLHYKKLKTIDVKSNSYYYKNGLSSNQVYYFIIVGYVKYNGKIVNMKQSDVVPVYIK